MVDPTNLENLEDDIVETLCLLEKIFPSSFFDIMIHLIVHLVRGLCFCGPFTYKWMYPFER